MNKQKKMNENGIELNGIKWSSKKLSHSLMRDYLVVRDYLKVHSGFSELLEPISDNGIICNADGIIVEVEFDDDKNLITYHQIYELVDKDTPELWPVNEDRYVEVFDRIEELANEWIIEIQRVYLNHVLSDMFS